MELRFGHLLEWIPPMLAPGMTECHGNRRFGLLRYVAGYSGASDGSAYGLSHLRINQMGSWYPHCV